MAERSVALLLAVLRLVDRLNEEAPLHQRNGGNVVRWPTVVATLDYLQPGAGWTDSTVRKTYKTIRHETQESQGAMIASVQIKDLAEIVKETRERGMRPVRNPPVLPGVNLEAPKPKETSPKVEKDEPTEPDVATDIAYRKKEKEANFYRKGYEKLLDERADMELVLETVRESIAALPPVEMAHIPAPSVILWNRPRRLMPLLSDMHTAEKVDPLKIKGFNEYNLKTLDERLDTWCTEIEEHFQYERAAGPVEMIHIPMIGDMVTGENIYRGQWMHIEATAMHQIFLCSDKLGAALLRLSKLGVPIMVDGVGGNHGRMGKRGESDFSNDFLMYKFLEARLSSQPNIRFSFDYAFWSTARHWDWRFYFCHGDNIRGWGGYPWYGQARADANTLQLMLTRGEWYHFFVHGHFHTDMSIQTPIGRRLANGNWIGTTEYGVNGGFTGRPCQKLLVLTEEKGIESEVTIYLDNITVDFMNQAAAGHGLGMSLRPW